LKHLQYTNTKKITGFHIHEKEGNRPDLPGRLPIQSNQEGHGKSRGSDGFRLSLDIHTIDGEFGSKNKLKILQLGSKSPKKETPL